MKKRSRLRTMWSRRSLATKLTISNTATFWLVFGIFVVAVGTAVIVESRRASAADARRTADSMAVAIEETLDAFHDTVLLSRVGISRRLLDDLDPVIGTAAGLEHFRTHVDDTSDLLLITDDTGVLLSVPDGIEVPETDLAAIVAGHSGQDGPFFHPFSVTSQANGGETRFHSCSVYLPGWDLIVLAATEEMNLIGRVPDSSMGRILSGGQLGTTVAAALVFPTGESVHTYGDWQEVENSLPPMLADVAENVISLDRTLGRSATYLATANLDCFDLRVAIAFAADRREVFLGKLLLWLAGAGIALLIVVIVVSRQTAALITAPVRRTAHKLLGAATGDEAELPAGDELATLVRKLLRASVKLEYEQHHREHAEDELAIAGTVYRNTNEGIFVLDPEGRISRINPAFGAITGWKLSDIREEPAEKLVPEDARGDEFKTIVESLRDTGEWVGELEMLKASGETVPTLLSVRVVTGPNDQPRHYIGVARDISDIRATNDRLEHLASHDPLTGLTNRAYLSTFLERIVETRLRRGGRAAVFFVDIDHFKDVNDAHGHHAGDELLQTVANRLKETIRAEDMIARFGGDEFVIVITEFNEVSEIEEVARRMLNRVREPAIVGGITVRPSATVGVAMYPVSGSTAEDLLKNADAAMYEAKRVGRGGYRFHDTNINEALRVRLAVRDRVRFSLRTGDFTLLWQPVVRASDNTVVGAEALIRLKNNGSLELPSSFMPQIEGSPVIIEMARWVLATTSETLNRLDAQLPQGFRVAVNVSATEILQRGFVAEVLEALESNSAAPTRLAVELTEGAAIRDIPTAQRVIRELREKDVSVYLDDFGVGYSSLQYLRELGISAVKLDKSFLVDVPESATSCSLVRGVVDMAHGLGLKTIVEGVERAEQLKYLQSINCDNVQGYLTGRPMEVAHFIKMLQSDGAKGRQQ